MERLNGEVRDREKIMRGLKNADTPILTGYQIYHNYVRPHEALEGKTPAEASGIKVEGKNKWLTIIQNASKLYWPSYSILLHAGEIELTEEITPVEGLPKIAIRKKGSIKDPRDPSGKKRRRFEIVKTVPIPQSKLPKWCKGKVYVLQKLMLEDEGEYFRIGYYIMGFKGKAKGKWVWGQYSPMGPIEDLKTLLETVKSERLID
jgi:hypothetical protein